MLRYQVEGMSCGHCVQTVTKAVKNVDPKAEVKVDLGAHSVVIENSDKSDAIAAAIRGVGYPVDGIA